MEKVIDIEERIPSMRKKRRRRTNKKFSFVLFVFVIALLITLYFQSALSEVGKLTINETVLHESQFYEEQSGLAVGDALWGFRIEEIEKSLGTLIGVEQVTVKRKWLRDVDIRISERDTVAYIEEKGRYSLLLENGELFATELLLAKAPILNGFTDEAIRKRMAKQLMKLDEEVYHLISEITFEGTKDDIDSLRVYMDDGFEVRAVISTFAEKMTYYPEITAQLNGLEKGVIDVEVGTYFTPFSKVYGLIKEDGDPIDEEE